MLVGIFYNIKVWKGQKSWICYNFGMANEGPKLISSQKVWNPKCQSLSLKWGWAWKRILSSFPSSKKTGLKYAACLCSCRELLRLLLLAALCFVNRLLLNFQRNALQLQRDILPSFAAIKFSVLLSVGARAKLHSRLDKLLTGREKRHSVVDAPVCGQIILSFLEN